MANTSPHMAREAKARKRLDSTDPGNLKRLQGKLWGLLDRIDHTLAEDDKITPENTRVVYAFSQIALTYLKAREVGELEERVAALEATSAKGRS